MNDDECKQENTTLSQLHDLIKHMMIQQNNMQNQILDLKKDNSKVVIQSNVSTTHKSLDSNSQQNKTLEYLQKTSTVNNKTNVVPEVVIPNNTENCWTMFHNERDMNMQDEDDQWTVLDSYKTSSLAQKKEKGNREKLTCNSSVKSIPIKNCDTEFVNC